MSESTASSYSDRSISDRSVGAGSTRPSVASQRRVELLGAGSQLETGDPRVGLREGELLGQVTDVVRQRQRREPERGQDADRAAVGRQEAGAGVTGDAGRQRVQRVRPAAV